MIDSYYNIWFLIDLPLGCSDSLITFEQKQQNLNGNFISHIYVGKVHKDKSKKSNQLNGIQSDYLTSTEIHLGILNQWITN